ncbi:hypothetical protein [Bradyrhizobium algeriense]|uniref:hypothetical protein n=1 Tax=Bradyrhizobium algeriense TaxID=634784 RepID=UPI003B8458D9
MTSHDRVVAHVAARPFRTIRAADHDAVLVENPHGTSRRQLCGIHDLVDARQSHARDDDGPYRAGVVKNRTRLSGNPLGVQPAYDRLAYRELSFARRFEIASPDSGKLASILHRPLRRPDVVACQVEQQNVVQIGRQIGLYLGKNHVVLFGIRRIGGDHFADNEQQGIDVTDVVIDARRCRVRRVNRSGPRVRKIFVEPFPKKSGRQKQQRQNGGRDESQQARSDTSTHWECRLPRPVAAGGQPAARRALNGLGGRSRPNRVQLNLLAARQKPPLAAI